MADIKAEVHDKSWWYIGAVALCVIGFFLFPSRGLALGTYTISIGQTVTVRWSNANVTQASQTVWTLSNLCVSKEISDPYYCTVKGVKEGTSNVTANIYYYFLTADNRLVQMSANDSFTIKVVAPQATSVALNYSSCVLNEGSMLTLYPTLQPSNATTSYTWTSSNTGVASVSSNGVVTAVSLGSAIITVKTSNNITAQCMVNVTDPLATVVSTQPANQGQTTSTVVKPTAVFSAAVIAALHFSSIRLVNKNTQATVSGSAAITDKQLTFTPDEPLSAGTSYQFIIPAQAVQNRYGTMNNIDTVITFTTTPFITITPNPSEAQENVPTTNALQILFDTTITKGSAFGNIKLATGNTIVQMTATVSNRTLTITPSTAMSALTYHTLTIPANAVANATGINYGQQITLHFTTALATNTFMGGTGTADDPYLVGTEQQLCLINTLRTMCFKLTNDIRLTSSWVSLCTSGAAFSGTLDGNHHTVFNVSASNANNGGFFHDVSGATIRNLRIKMSDYALALNISVPFNALGLLAEKATGATITGCSVVGSISVTGSTDASRLQYCGALIGYASNCNVTGCSAYMNQTLKYSGSQHFGGLIGNAQNCTINHCTYSGGMSANNSNAMEGSTGQVFACGALVGYNVGGAINNSTVNWSCSFEHIKFLGLTELYVAGIAGYTSGDVSGCTVTGSMTVNSQSGYSSLNESGRKVFIGGLLGKVTGKTVAQCHTNCTINTQVTYYAGILCHAGGLIGYMDNATANNCYANGYTSAAAKTNFSNTLVRSFIGGLAGIMINNSTIHNSYTTGNTRGRSLSNSGSNFALVSVGSLTGYSKDSVAEYCYSTGTCYGGDPYGSGDVTANAFVDDCYTSTLTCCYTLTSDVTATTLTSAQMHQTASFVNWDFANTWGIDITVNNGYPILNPPIKGVTATGCECSFDAQPHSITVSAPANTTVQYSLDGSTFASLNPSFSSTVVPVTVFYKVTQGDQEMTGLATVKILPVITGMGMNNGTLNVCVGAHYRTPVTLTCANPQLAGVIWTSSDPAILDFDADGWLIAKAPGTVNATCTAWDGSGLTLHRSFNVHEKVAVYMSPFIKEINTRAFATCDFDEMNMLACEELFAIGSRAFADCVNLNALYIGDNVQAIAADAFAGCKLLYLYCFEGSAAHTYAVNNGIPYVLMQR